MTNISFANNFFTARSAGPCSMLCNNMIPHPRSQTSTPLLQAQHEMHVTGLCTCELVLHVRACAQSSHVMVASTSLSMHA